MESQDLTDSITGINFEQAVTLDAGEVRDVVFDSSDFPQLSIEVRVTKWICH